MPTQAVKLIDQSGNVLATAEVTNDGAVYGGIIDLHDTPPELCALFAEFEEIVNGQMFSFLDEIQEKISSHCIQVVFDPAHEVYVKDLQVFPSIGDVSFKLAEESSRAR